MRHMKIYVVDQIHVVNVVNMQLVKFQMIKMLQLRLVHAILILEVKNMELLVY